MRRAIPLFAVASLALASAAIVPGAAASPTTYETRVLIRGSTLHGANGLAVDAAGRLLVASVWGGEVVAVDRQTGEILERFDEDVDGPDDVAVGPDGSIYWTDILLGEVGRLDPGGHVTKQFVAPGVNPLAFTGDGELLVGQAFFGDGLYEVDPGLTDPPREVIPDSGTPPFPAQLNGFDFGPDGMLYAPQPFLGNVVRIDPESGAMELVTEGLEFPSSVEFDAEGRLFASLAFGDIVRINPRTGTHRVAAHIPDAVLDNMVFDTRGRLFVSDSDQGAVYRVRFGEQIRTLVRGGLILPGGLAIMQGREGRRSLFVADLWSLARFSPTTGALLEVERQSRGGGSIVEPWTVAPDKGNVIVTSWMSNAVQVWDPVSDSEVEVYHDFAVPLNAIRFQGDLVVSELGTGSVAREDAQTGERTVIADGLFVPTGLAASKDDLWVADWASGVVWQLVADGAVLDPPMFVAGGLASPEGLALDLDGTLLVAEAGAGRLTRIDQATGQTTTVIDGLAMGQPGPEAVPPTFAFSGVAVRKTGAIFVSGDVSNVVYRLRPVEAD